MAASDFFDIEGPTAEILRDNAVNAAQGADIGLSERLQEMLNAGEITTAQDVANLVASGAISEMEGQILATSLGDMEGIEELDVEIARMGKAAAAGAAAIEDKDKTPEEHVDEATLTPISELIAREGTGAVAGIAELAVEPLVQTEPLAQTGMQQPFDINAKVNEDTALIGLQVDAVTGAKIADGVKDAYQKAGVGQETAQDTKPDAIVEVGAHQTVPTAGNAEFAKLASQFAGLVNFADFPTFAVGGDHAPSELGSFSANAGLPNKAPQTEVGGAILGA